MKFFSYDLSFRIIVIEIVAQRQAVYCEWKMFGFWNIRMFVSFM